MLHKNCASVTGACMMFLAGATSRNGRLLTEYISWDMDCRYKDGVSHLEVNGKTFGRFVNMILLDTDMYGLAWI